MKIRVLIADDHAMIRDGLAALLKGDERIEVAGFASDGREAVRLARDLAPDVVLMDFAMPGMNGVEALREIQERAPDSRVLILSMFSSLEHVQQAFNAGAGGYLLKESAGSELRRAIEHVHTGRRYLSRQLEAHASAVLARGTQRTPLETLSRRERQILQLVVEGRSSADIGATLHLSAKTVETYRSRLMQKLGVDGVAALVKFAIAHGLTPPA
jgi:DNA-binding NarL/FixJ family response regulator